MTELENEITINGSLKAIWETLNTVTMLDQFDPTVKTSTSTSMHTAGLGASRKVEMKDGKNWFEEKCTLSDPLTALQFELTACSFPVHSLQHRYSFETIGTQIKVKQVMHYKMKYGVFGKIMDVLIVKKQSNTGIQLFLKGLKNHIEQLEKKTPIQQNRYNSSLKQQKHIL